MIKNKKDNQQQITKKILIEVLDAKFLQYDKKMDIKFDQKFAEYDKKMDLKLGHFAEDIIIPAMNSMIDEKLDEKFRKHQVQERTYLDNKLSDLQSDILMALEGHKEQDRSFKLKLLDIMGRNKLVKPDEIKALLALAN